MEDKVREEIETLHDLIQRWKMSWFALSQPQIETDPRFLHIKQDERHSSDNYTWILEDFLDELTNTLIPYVARLREAGHITELEQVAFYDRAKAEVVDLRRLLGLPGPEEGVAESS